MKLLGFIQYLCHGFLLSQPKLLSSVHNIYTKTGEEEREGTGESRRVKNRNTTRVIVQNPQKRWSRVAQISRRRGMLMRCCSTSTSEMPGWCWTTECSGHRGVRRPVRTRILTQTLDILKILHLN